MVSPQLQMFLYKSSEGVSIEVCDTTSEDLEGTTIVEMGPHNVELVSVDYDPSTDQTTVTYQVTSGNPLIKSVSFDIPDAIGYDEIRVASENWADSGDIVTGYNTKDKTHGDNGLGNGADDQPPGMPPENDVVFQYTDGDGNVVVPVYKTDDGVWYETDPDDKKVRTYYIDVDGDPKITLYA